MSRDSHQKAAELHQLAAHSHLAAAAHHDKQEHQTGQELSRQAQDYSARAFAESQIAHQKSIAADNAAKSLEATPAS